MSKSIINIEYEKLTEEDLEKYVEFVDWYKVPFNLFTDNIIRKFDFLEDVKDRIIIEELLEGFYMKLDMVLRPYRLFLYFKEVPFAEINLKSGKIVFSNSLFKKHSEILMKALDMQLINKKPVELWFDLEIGIEGDLEHNTKGHGKVKKNSYKNFKSCINDNKISIINELDKKSYSYGDLSNKFYSIFNFTLDEKRI